MPKSGSSGASASGNNNEQLFPPLNYSRSYFTQWLLKDTEDCLLWKDPPSHQKNHHHCQQQNHHHQQSNQRQSSPNVKRNNMELIQLLAINALEFTAPVYSFLNKDCNKPSPVPAAPTASKTPATPVVSSSSQARKKEEGGTSSTNSSKSASGGVKSISSVELNELKLNREFIQLSGHPGSFAPAGPNSIWKKLPLDSANEASVYEKLRESEGDPLRDLIPTYISKTEWNGSIFIELEDLVTRFNLESLNIMDLKLGIRTFLESEVTNNKPRGDLYEKMLKLDPNGATAEEKESKSVTKLRYMQFREELSSTKKLGFRIEGVKLSSDKTRELVMLKSVNLARLTDEAQICKVLKAFLLGTEEQKQFVVKKLTELRDKLQNSHFFMTHEIIGSSLLLIHDNVKFGAWIIDFAKTFQVEHLSHRAPWIMGNREDGVLTGIDNVIRLLTKAVLMNE